MHRDLKAEATKPPSANLAAQQRRFERWRHTYNHERPHESLDQHTPAEYYHPSARRLGENDNPVVYPRDHEVKVVSDSGHLAHEGRNHHLGEAFAGKRIGLRRADDGRTEVHFANVHLGHLAFDAEGGRFTPTAYVAPLRPTSQPPPPPAATRARGGPHLPTTAASGGYAGGEGAKPPPQHPSPNPLIQAGLRPVGSCAPLHPLSQIPRYNPHFLYIKVSPISPVNLLPISRSNPDGQFW